MQLRRLDGQGANPFRVKAYRTAAEMLRRLDRPAVEVLRGGGRRALMQLPGIGPRLAVTLEGLLLTGHIQRIEAIGDRPEDLFATLTGVGPATAKRIHDTLHVETT